MRCESYLHDIPRASQSSHGSHGGRRQRSSSSDQPRNPFETSPGFYRKLLLVCYNYSMTPYDDTKLYECFQTKSPDDYIYIFKMVSSLGPQDKAIFYLTFKWGFELAEIAETFGFTPSNINQRLKKIVKFLGCKVKNKPTLLLVR